MTAVTLGRAPSTLMAACRAASGSDAATASRPVIPLSSGLNTLTLTAASLPARAFLAHRDNGNAHGFDVLTLYIEVPIGEGALPEWQLVSTFDERDEKRHGVPRGEHLTLNTSDGADCRLSDFRLLAATDKADALLILADREFGEERLIDAAVRHRDCSAPALQARLAAAVAAFTGGRLQDDATLIVLAADL